MSEINGYGWTTTTIRQEDGTADCVACVAAMATGTTVEAFKAWCGQPVGPYSDLTLMAYLLAHGLHMGTGFATSPDAGDYPAIEHRWEFEGGAAYLGVRSRRYEGLGHAVLWNGERVLDPSEDEPQRKDLYEIETVWPIYRLPRPECSDPRLMVRVPETMTAARRILEMEAEIAGLRGNASRVAPERYAHLDASFGEGDAIDADVARDEYGFPELTAPGFQVHVVPTPVGDELRLARDRIMIWQAKRYRTGERSWVRIRSFAWAVEA